MAYAIISDIHSNIEALEVVLDDIKNKEIKDICCLGDIIGYGANPSECCNLVRKNCKAGAIFGNHDASIIQDYVKMLEQSLMRRIMNKLSTNKNSSKQDFDLVDIEDPWMGAVIHFTKNALPFKNKAYLASLPMTIAKEGLLFTHQNPTADAFNPEHSNTILFRRNLSYLFDVYEYFKEDPIMETRGNVDVLFLNRQHEEQTAFALDHLRQNNIRICFMGHTHVASCFYKKEKDHTPTSFFIKYNTPEDPECKSSFEFELEEEYNYIINPGSVGQPRDTDPRASYLIVDGKKITWHRIPYAVQRASQKIRDAKLPPYYADRLEKGI